jgi:hypothetical protein
MTRAAIAVTLGATVVLAGCGGGSHRAAPPQPKLPAAVAEQLATRSDDVANKLDAGDRCGALAAAQQLQHQTTAAINAGRVPAALQEPLSGAANDLASRITCPPKPQPQPPAEDKHGKGEHKGKGKHQGEGD